MFQAAVVVVALIAGGIAAIAGFGIGSLLTPLLPVPLGTKLTVAVVSVPRRIPETIFRRGVAFVVIILGAGMLVRGLP